MKLKLIMTKRALRYGGLVMYYHDLQWYNRYLGVRFNDFKKNYIVTPKLTPSFYLLAMQC
jgi:hypothetical protein